MLLFVRNVAALLFLVPGAVALCVRRPFLAAACMACTFAALMHTNYERVEYASLAVLQAMDAVAAVVVTFVCSLHLNVHKTIIGMLRVLWLVTLVTSSSSYDFFKSMAPNVSIIPNDITVITLAACGGLLIATIVYSRFCARDRTTRDPRAIVVELLFVAGAMMLRFEDDIEEVIHQRVGWMSWYICATVAALCTLYLVVRPAQASHGGREMDDAADGTDLRHRMRAEEEDEVSSRPRRR